jgi:hypothetical protein
MKMAIQITARRFGMSTWILAIQSADEMSVIMACVISIARTIGMRMERIR